MKKFLLLTLFFSYLLGSKAQIYNTIVTVAGGNGMGDSSNQLNNPWGVFIDGNNNIYVADQGNNRIQKFPAESTSVTNGITLAGGNGIGSAANQFGTPSGIFLDKSNNLYVADVHNNRVLKFPANSTSATNGTTVAGGNGMGSAANQLNGPGGIYLDSAGNLYVADLGNNRIQKFPAGSDSTTMAVTAAGGNGIGSDANQLYYPMSVYLDKSGNIYVADEENNRIQKFLPNSTSSTNGVTVAGGSYISYGSGADQLTNPTGVYIDGNGNIYVVDQGNERIQKFPPNSTSGTDGVTVAGGNGLGSNADQLSIASGIFIDSSANIYIADWGNNRIQKWSQSPAGISSIPSNGNISLYPNPNSGSFILQSSGSIGKDYTVYDMIGRAVAQGTITADKQNIALKGISLGSYTLEVPGNKAVRFVIEN